MEYTYRGYEIRYIDYLEAYAVRRLGQTGVSTFYDTVKEALDMIDDILDKVA